MGHIQAGKGETQEEQLELGTEVSVSNLCSIIITYSRCKRYTESWLSNAQQIPLLWAFCLSFLCPLQCVQIS